MSTHDETTIGELRPGERFAGFAIGEVIGRGAFATVYRLHDPRTGASVDRCVKVGHTPAPLPMSSPAGPFPTRCFWANSEFVGLAPAGPDEIRNVLGAEYAYLRDHSHDLFPRVAEAGEVRGMPCYAMEYLAGPTLRQLLAADLPPDATTLLPGFVRLVRDLSALRAADPTFVHGDLKPENIVVTGDRWRLIDPARGQWTNEFPGLCTRAYTPWPDPYTRDGRADTCALTIVLFEIIAHWQPFAALSPGGIIGGGPRYSPSPDDPDAWSLLATERCARYAREPFLRQLLAWMAAPPTDAALAEFITLIAIRRSFPDEPEAAVAFARRDGWASPPPGKLVPNPPPGLADAVTEDSARGPSLPSSASGDPSPATVAAPQWPIPTAATADTDQEPDAEIARYTAFLAEERAAWDAIAEAAFRDRIGRFGGGVVFLSYVGIDADARFLQRLSDLGRRFRPAREAATDPACGNVIDPTTGEPSEIHAVWDIVRTDGQRAEAMYDYFGSLMAKRRERIDLALVNGRWRVVGTRILAMT